jgi:GR25 family glycosyltransferase involved in LPS biosynthesis
VSEYDRENMGDREHLYEFNKKYTDKPINGGQISLTLKHYKALEEIVKSEVEVAVIMEDNVEFETDIKKLVDEYLKEAPEDWDIIFEGDTHYLKYKEGEILKGKRLYKKTNKKTDQCLGSARCSNFYILNLECAKKLYKSFVPFYTVCDHWSNYLFRQLKLNIYWVEPPKVHRIMSHARVAESGHFQ